MTLFFINIIISIRHFKLEIAVTIPASNELERVVNKG